MILGIQFMRYFFYGLRAEYKTTHPEVGISVKPIPFT